MRLWETGRVINRCFDSLSQLFNIPFRAKFSQNLNVCGTENISVKNIRNICSFHAVWVDYCHQRAAAWIKCKSKNMIHCVLGHMSLHLPSPSTSATVCVRQDQGWQTWIRLNWTYPLLHVCLSWLNWIWCSYHYYVLGKIMKLYLMKPSLYLITKRHFCCCWMVENMLPKLKIAPKLYFCHRKETETWLS